MRKATLATTLCLLGLVGCGAHQMSAADAIKPVSVADRAALKKRVEAFYMAESAASMSQALMAVEAQAPDTAVYHEVAGVEASLRTDERTALQHFAEGARDGSAANTALLLDLMHGINWTLPERRRLVRLWNGLINGHPDAAVRAAAGWHLMVHGRLTARVDLVQRGGKQLGFRPSFSFIGPFENDQGKGADAVYGPEREVDFSRKYDDQRGAIAWREVVPVEPTGLVDLGEIFYPKQWRVAYGVTAVKAAQAGAYELRLTTSDGVKVWVNDTLVFDNRKLSREAFDGLVIPINLASGANRILVKSIQSKGSWRLFGRITAKNGELPAAGQLQQLPNDTPIGPEGRQLSQSLVDIDTLLDRKVENIFPEVRRAAHRIYWTRRFGLPADAAKYAEAVSRRYPTAIYFTTLLAYSLWDNQERGRTADILDKLVQSVGALWPRIELLQARFWQQQKMHDKARELLRKTVEKHPDAIQPRLALAGAYKKERWHTERCQLLEPLAVKWTDWPNLQYRYGDCLEDQRFYSRAEAIYLRLLRQLPNSRTILHRLYWHAVGNERHAAAERYATRFTQALPHKRLGWMNLAEVSRRMGAFDEARAALGQAMKITPRHPTPYVKLGAIELQAGRRERAIQVWKDALSRNPDDQGLLSRVDWMAPETAGPWRQEVPSMEDIKASLMSMSQVKLKPGADVVYVLDDEVSLLNADGSSSNYVTTVALSVNQSGRDKLTKLKLRAGRHKILMAFAIGPKGKRQEASSIRRNTVRFRQLEVGSAVVLQYRVDERANGYLSGYMGKNWWFETPNAQVVKSRWVLWTPAKTTLNQEVVGDPVESSVRNVDGMKRYEWVATDQAPILSEPRMPGLREVANHLAVSTVPDWAMFFEWEKALLVDAFRESPEVVALADKLKAGTSSKQDIVERIHAHVMGKIRYQQDYERYIAGVKPHPAPVVIARQYGDCKDKAVLFITLARLAGVKAHFALVRTRDAGPVRRTIPMQQFNHAIVYVPKQEGIDTGRFYDPTVDVLDVASLRHDDQGTWSIVYDPMSGEHTWRQIPFQKADLDLENLTMEAALRPNGSLRGEVKLEARGRGAEFVRKAARNPDVLKRLLTRLTVQEAMPNAAISEFKATEVESVFKPARVAWSFGADNVAVRDGQTVRMKIPIRWKPMSGFELQERKHPVLLGIKRTLEFGLDLALPKGTKVLRQPTDENITSKCLAFERKVTVDDDMLRIRQKVLSRCERVSVEDYGSHRDWVAKTARAIGQELVLRMPRTVVASH